MCPRSSAAATPVKYKRDIQQLTYVLKIVKKSENNGTEEISLVTPTPGPVKLHTVTDKNFKNNCCCEVTTVPVNA